MGGRHQFDSSNRRAYDSCPACGAPPHVPCMDRRTIYPCPDTGATRPRFLTWVHPQRLDLGGR